MSELTPVTVEDRRRHNFYIIDNEVIDDYAATAGVYGIAVYNVLCRFADRASGETIPVSIYRIAHLLHCGQNQVRAAIKTLKQIGLLEVKRHYDKKDGQLCNTYFLLDVPKKIGAINLPPLPERDTPSPGAGIIPLPERDTPSPGAGDDQDSGINTNGNQEEEAAVMPPASHPAIQAFRKVYNRYPRKNTWSEIAGRVGEDEASIDQWYQLCRWWKLAGSNPDNVGGALNKFEKVTAGIEPMPAMNGIEEARQARRVVGRVHGVKPGLKTPEQIRDEALARRKQFEKSQKGEKHEPEG